MSAEDEPHGGASRVGAHKHRCPGHAELLLAVDAELGPVDAEASDVALDALAWHVMPADPDPREDLARIAALADGPRLGSPRGRMGAWATRTWTGDADAGRGRLDADAGRGRPGADAGRGRAFAGRQHVGRAPLRVSPTGTLRLSEALMGLPAHPLVVAVAMVEAAHRAGMHTGLVGCDDTLLVAHHHLREPLVVDPSLPGAAPVDAHECSRGADLRWRCAHQSACTILDRVADDAQRRGDIARAIRAAELRLDLPFDDDALARRRDEVARVRARLN